MSLASTQFNPFGQHESSLGSLKTQLEEISSFFQKEIETGSSKTQGLSEDVKKFPKVLDQLTDIVKDIPESAVQSLLTEIVSPLSKVVRNFAENSEKLKPTEMLNLSRTITKFIQMIADRIVEPFNSEVLEQWSPLFEALVSARNNSLKEIGASLWKNTFGKVKVPITYPGTLRATLEKLPKKYMITLPPAAKNISPIFADDESMDVLSAKESVKIPSVKPDESQGSFQFSQQPMANEVADKILMEQKTKLICDKTSSESPRRRPSRMPSLLDEDTSDFVAIASTPPSNKKNKLTDRQKEKLAEATGPRTSINYMDEESQSGLAKKENLKKALTAMNFDVGEESVSVPTPKKAETSGKPISPKIEEPTSTRRTSKRSRKLFIDSPSKSDTSENPDVKKTGDTVCEKLESIPQLTESSPTPRKRSKICNDQDSPEGKTSLTESLQNSEEIVDTKVDSSSKKRPGRPKKTPKQCLPTDPVTKKHLRSSLSSRTSTSESVCSVESSEVIEPSTESSTSTVSAEVVSAVPEVEKSDDKKEEAEDVHPEVKKERTPETTVESKEIDQEEKPDVVVEETSPAKPVARTPSILRVGKRIVDANSPMSERKKNRVHFNEDSLPQDVPTTPTTPRRKKLTIEIKSSPMLFESSTLPISNNLLAIPSPATISSISAIFPSLVGCPDSIDNRIIQKMYGHFNVQAITGFKKSLQEMGVSTVGDFAALSPAKVEKLTWIKGRTSAEKLKSAKSALTEHEKNRSTDRIVDDIEETGKVKGSESPTKSSEVETVPVTGPETANVDDVAPNPTKNDDENAMEVDNVAVVEKLPEPVPATVQSLTKTPEFVASAPIVPQIAKIIEKTPEASQSPASPVSTVEPNATVPVEPVVNSANVRKNLAPIFFDKSKIKEEVMSPQKTIKKNEKPSNEESFMEDGRLLYRICSNLSHAHTSQWPTENSKSILKHLNKAVMVFKDIVQSRGSGEWDDVDFEDADDSADVMIAVEDDVKSLVGVYKRFLSCHTKPDAAKMPWMSVMQTINEAACLLRIIVSERNSNC